MCSESPGLLLPPLIKLQASLCEVDKPYWRSHPCRQGAEKIKVYFCFPFEPVEIGPC